MSGKGKKSKDMPAKAQVEESFATLMDNLAVKPDKKRAMMAMPLENKWLMIKQYEGIYTSKKESKAADHVAQLKSVVSAKDMESITVDMMSKPVPWLLEFVQEGGVAPLFVQLTTVLSKPEKVESDVKLLGNFVNCIRGLMNGSEEAIKAVSTAKGATLALIKCLDYISPKAHRNIWELLVAICYISEDSHVQLAENLSKLYKPVDGRKKTSGIKKLKWFLEKGDDGSKGIVMTLVNGLVNKCTRLDDRMSTRANIGIDDALKEKLEKINNERLVHQLVIYKEEEEADDLEYREVGSGEKEAKRLALALLETLKIKSCFPHFVSLLGHMELLRSDDRVGEDSFLLLDIFSQSIAHASHTGNFNEFAKEVCDSTLQDLGVGEPSSHPPAPGEAAVSHEQQIVKLQETLKKQEETVKKQEDSLAESKKATRTAKEESTKLRVEANELRQALEHARGGAPVGDPAKEAALQQKITELQHQVESSDKKVKEAEKRAKEAEQKAKEAAAIPPPEPIVLPAETDDNRELLQAIEKLRGDVVKHQKEALEVREELENAQKELVVAKEAAAKAAEGAPPPGGGPPPPPPGGPPPPPGGGPPPPPGGGPPPPPPPPGGGPPPPPPPPGGGGPPPPPPPGGGPPPPPGSGPPPPPGGGPAMGRPPKAKKDPPVKMKAFNWSKIPDAKIDGTIWEELDDEKIKINLEGLTDMFCTAKPKAKDEEGKDGEKKDTGKPSKPKVASVLDFNRSNNINILVKRFKKTPEEMKKAIINCDDDIMSGDNIRALLKVVPTHDELDMIKEYPTPEELGGAEQFLMALGDIPRLEAKLKALLIKTGFEKRASTVEEQMNVLEKAIDEVSGSKKLPEFLGVVLKVGNFMNGKGARGGAYGFKLTDLVKLADTKSLDNKTTLLGFLIQVFEKNKPEMLKLPEDFPSVQDAARESLNEVSKDVNQLETDRNFSKRLVEGEDVPRDSFHKKISSFLEEADASLGDLTARKTTIEQKFTKLKKTFFELPGTDTNTFFETLTKFFGLFHSTFETILRQRKAAEDKAKAEKRRQEAFSKGGGKPKEGGEEDMGALDKILHQAQTGGARVQRNPKPRGPPMGMGPPGGPGGFDPAALRAGLKRRQPADS
eukprot:CAMPEP_0201487742 /NCGR_PEP_ID=MMETSP0151_2-20130828/15198_1 /ASSEMBLY_ACC=CAM_ASM_000257 /TAXON_ID=200890 /ORGANISM="Paramoeba atlantica, Strain 621/1 / CCAP 1560/9" /LENGTH=1120 /DNA_ID=CAMNT_0047872885 /DNA_START=156 /DNA_END=3518 /DNA_ORIENTATION=-